MAQCSTEAKPYNSSSFHMHGSAYTEKFFSLNHVNGNSDRVHGHIVRESSLKEGGGSKGNGSLGMPGVCVYKANKGMHEDNADIRGRSKSNIKEERPNTKSTKARASGVPANSRPHSSNLTSASSAISRPTKPHTKIKEGCSVEGALKVNSSVLSTGSSKADESKSRNLVGRGFRHGKPVHSDARSSLNPSKSAAKKSSLWSGDSRSEGVETPTSGIETGVEGGSSAPWNGSGDNCAVKGRRNTDYMNSGTPAFGKSRELGKKLKSNQPCRGSFVKDSFMTEISGGRHTHSPISAGKDVSQVSGGDRDGTIMVGKSNLNAYADAGEVRASLKAEENGSTKPELLPGNTKTPAQSWPNSPADLRAVPRSRNLSEGSFNLIFPAGDLEKAMRDTTSTTGSPSRSSVWSTNSVDSKTTSTSRSSLDQPLLATATPKESIHENSRSSLDQPLLATAIPKESIHENSRSPVIKSPAGDPQFGCSDKFSSEHKSSNDSGSISGTKLEPPENPGPKLMPLVCENNLIKIPSATSSQPESQALSEPSRIQKISVLDHQHKISMAQASCDLHSIPASGHSSDKIFNTGGSPGYTVSTSTVASQDTRTSEGTIPPVFGNITKGHQNSTKLTTLPSTFGNIVKENSRSDLKKSAAQTNAHAEDDSFLLGKALSSMDPEEVKSYGNNEYKKGKFSEALLLYKRAIVLSPGQALYYSNRAAALAALGRLGDAVQDCQEAIKLDPLYGRAHQRLASLFLRLGRAEDAKQHFKSAGNLSDLRDIQRSDIILWHTKKCFEAREATDWVNVIRESDAVVVAGADSASKVFALKAEALLHMGKTDEAKRVISAAQKVQYCLRGNALFDGSIVEVIQAEVDLALGNFQDAILAAEKAVQIDLKNAKAVAVLQKARAIGRSRTIGNELYKAGKYFEASSAYGEGLEHDPTNAVLLCNRAACRSNLELWESAIEDCNAALSTQPNYTKAQLRRAHCLSKLEHWKDALRDYEMLKKELPDNTEVAKALLYVQTALKKSHGEEPHSLWCSIK